MNSSQSRTFRLLLGHIPETDQASAARSIAHSLNVNSGSVELQLAFTMLELYPDRLAQQALLEFLDELIQRGRHDQIKSYLLQDDEIILSHLPGRQILFLSHLLNKLRMASGTYVVNPFNHESKDLSYQRNQSIDDELDIAAMTERAIHVLQFISYALTKTTGYDSLCRTFFDQCLLFLGVANKALVKAAQKSLFSLLSYQNTYGEKSEHLWPRIRDLVTCENAFYKTIGFGLWLRWLLSERVIVIPSSEQPNYWKLIVDGLRLGDSERRKIALQIMRASMDVAAKHPSLLPAIGVARPSSIEVPAVLHEQCDRFCTIFQTIVLGRYLNQVQECEADLDFLASSKSLLKSVWLYTLLSSALDQSMQDSNRKFIGTWFMRSRPKVDDIEPFLGFFQRAFLSWASGGSLFTSTLRKSGNSIKCEHGHRLAAFIRDLISDHPQYAEVIVDALLDNMLARYGNNFAYSTVYLIDGIGQALDLSASSLVSSSHIAKIQRLAAWVGFPEVARDYILARSYKICQYETTHLSLNSQLTPWQILQDWLARIDSSSSARIDGNIASLTSQPSKRETHEQTSIRNCLELMKILDNEDERLSDKQYSNSIDRIWNDLEYLEYPRSLLVIVSSLIPHRSLIRAAKETLSESATMLQLLAAKVMELLHLSESRSYLFSSLMKAVRETTFHMPNATELIPVEDAILYFAGHPPAPTVDARLEDATMPLLTALGPGMEKLNYEYYFGPRETHGFAALLDLVSRLGSINPHMNDRIFSRLLFRWRHQKIPPPSVSNWKTMLQLQVMLICCDQFICRVDSSTAQDTLKNLHYILAVEPLPKYRYLMEWMIARTYLIHPDLRPSLFDELRTKDHHSNPKFLASLMKLGVMLAKTDDSGENFAQELASIFVPLAASSKVIIRHEAQWQIPSLMDHARANNWRSISQNTAFQALDDFIRSLERFGDPPLERRIDTLHPIKDHTLAHLVEGPWYELDSIEQRQTSREAFVTLQALDSEASYSVPQSCMALGNHGPPSHLTQEHSSLSSAKIDHNRVLLQNIDNISRALGSGAVSATALQTKGAAYLSSTSERAGPPHPQLHVVASLIDNPHNLGGLSRVSEIFGAGTLYVQNPHVMSNKDFTKVSVSSHLHFPIESLASADLAGWLSKQKTRDGYTVVGIEQTDRSILLGSDECVLPERCILVLGSEREGIPAAVLSECDLLIEIPQLGVTRSLNVQTAAGIVLCEYARQHNQKQ